MPNPIIPLPKFPQVAQLPGVPQLVRANEAINTVQLAVGAIQKFLGSPSKQLIWGVFDQEGNAVIKPDSYQGFENQNRWRIAQFPIQDGDFQSYNKIVIPRTITLKLTQGGSLQQRTTLLAALQAIANDTNLYNIIVPEGTYLNFNCEGYVIRRMGREGAYFFADLDVHFTNIKQAKSVYSSTTANTANAQNPAALPVMNLGTQLPQLTVLPSVRDAVNAAVANITF
jgi:hypothetical protein